VLKTRHVGCGSCKFVVLNVAAVTVAMVGGVVKLDCARIRTVSVGDAAAIAVIAVAQRGRCDGQVEERHNSIPGIVDFSHAHLSPPRAKSHVELCVSFPFFDFRTFFWRSKCVLSRQYDSSCRPNQASPSFLGYSLV